jgi:2-dehydropantoate 2-reductase
MHFLIFGTGAVGGYLGGRLAEAGNSVVFLARPATAESLRREGLRLEQGDEIRVVHDVDVLTELPFGHDLGPEAVVLLTVRAFDCADAAATLAERLRGQAPVVCLLNGIGNEATLAEAIGDERVVPATLTTAVEVRAPGVVRVERERGLGLARHALSGRLAATFREAGIVTRLYDDPDSMKWSKLPTNIVANASSAILDWTAAAVMAHPGLYRLEVEALREAFRVMRSAGHPPVNLPGVPVAWLARAIFLPPWATRWWFGAFVARGRGGKRPSFHRDLGRGRSEAPWLNGAVVREAQRLGLTAPANGVLLASLLERVEGAADAEAWRDRPERLLARAVEAGVPGMAPRA